MLRGDGKLYVRKQADLYVMLRHGVASPDRTNEWRSYIYQGVR